MKSSFAIRLEPLSEAYRQILRELVGVLLTQEDWETIAAVAADSLKAQIMQQVSVEKISA